MSREWRVVSGEWVAPLRGRRLLALGLIALIASCTTTQSAQKPDEKKVTKAAPAETPEIPDRVRIVEQRPAQKPVSEEREGQGGATVVKTVPAPESEVKAEEEAPPEPPIKKAPPEVEAAFEKATQAAAQGDNATAEAALKDAISRDEKSSEYAWTNLGVLYERERDYDKAESAYRKALAINPDQELAWDDLARLACRQGRAPAIENELRARVNESPSALGPRNALVFTLMQENKFGPAEAEAKKVLKADERNVRAMQLLAQVYFREDKYELSKMVLENARAIDPMDAVTHNSLGMTLLKLKARPQAMESFKQAASLNPNFAEALSNYGAMLVEAEVYDDAVKVLEQAKAAAPDYAPARMNLGNAYRGQGQFDKALAEYQAVLKLQPNNADTLYNLAILNLDSDKKDLDTIERYKTAIAYFNQYKDKGGHDERVEQYLKDANKGIEKEERRRERAEKDKLRKAQQEEEDKKRAEEEAKKKAEEAEAARIAAEKKAAEDAKKAAEEAEKARIAAEKQAAEDAKKKAAEEAKAAKEAEKQAAIEAKKQAAEEAKAKKQAELDAKKKAAEDAKAAKEAAIEEKKKAAADAKAAKEAEKQAAIEAKKKAAEDAKAAKEAEALAKKQAAEKAEADKKAAEAAKKNGAAHPASKLGDDEDETPPPPAPKKPPSGKLSDDEK